MTLILILFAVVMGAPQTAEMSFKKVECRTSFGAAEQGDDGRLQVSAKAIRFTKKNGREYFSIPSSSVNDVFYSRVSGRRIKTALAVTPFLLFSKGKKHYMTLSFNDGGGLVGAVEFKLHKSNYRGVLRAVEQVTGISMKFDHEGIKDEKETVAARGSTRDGELAALKIESDPANAEIEIDGAFAGTTPRTKRLEPGEYKIKISMKGYKTWERKIKVDAGEEIPITLKLEKK